MIFIHAYWSKEGERKFRKYHFTPIGREVFIGLG
jgi:hypothetical protein